MPLRGVLQVALCKVSIDLTQKVHRFSELSVGEGDHAAVTLVAWLEALIVPREPCAAY